MPIYKFPTKSKEDIIMPDATIAIPPNEEVVSYIISPSGIVIETKIKENKEEPKKTEKKKKKEDS